ncbi:MAG: OB-fold nucleic acid binding domain-containing protein [Ilumatobacteraceae bacterium]
MAGVVTKVERKFTRRGDSMMIVALEDLTGTIEVTVFAKQVDKHGHLIREDSVVAIRGRLNVSEERRSLQCIDVTPLVLAVGIPSVRLSFPLDRVGERTIDELKEILLRYPGDSPVFLHLGTSKVLRLPAKFNVDLQRAAADLRVAFGIDVLLSASAH